MLGDTVDLDKRVFRILDFVLIILGIQGILVMEYYSKSLTLDKCLMECVELIAMFTFSCIELWNYILN